jgi:thioredoxin 1
MLSQKNRSSRASQQTHFRMWFVLMVIMGLSLWVGGCGKGNLNAVVAEVNGERITVRAVQKEMARIPVEMRAVYEQNPAEALNQLISLTLLLQEAKRRGLVDSTDLRGLDNPTVQEGLRRLLEMEVQGEAKITDQEVAIFYRQHRDEMEGKSLSQVREAIHRMLLEQKQQQRISDVVGRLRTAAAITTYPERLPKPPAPPLEASTADDFRAALQSGRPSIIDFGSNRCIPCIQLRPVLRELKDAHRDRINVIFMEVNDHRDLALQYKVQLVPTVIFFDAKGREIRRTVGFMDREAIERVLRDLKFLGG